MTATKKILLFITQIFMNVTDDILHCKICDNGVGRSAVIKEETDTQKNH